MSGLTHVKARYGFSNNRAKWLSHHRVLAVNRHDTAMEPVVGTGSSVAGGCESQSLSMLMRDGAHLWIKWLPDAADHALPGFATDLGLYRATRFSHRVARDFR